MQVSRRDVMAAGGSLVLIPGVANIAIADTNSGNVELHTDATVPSSDYEIYITIYEDIDGDGETEYLQTITIGDGQQTHELDHLLGLTNEDIQYYLHIAMIGAGSDTPELHSAEVVLPQSNGDIEETTQTWRETFERQSSYGWTWAVEDLTVTETGVNGDWSLYETEPSESEGNILWSEGPTIDLSQEFTLDAVFRPKDDSAGSQIRFGLGVHTQNEGQNALIVFDFAEGVTFLDTHLPAEPGDDVINNAFNDTWINIKMRSNEGSDTVEAKVWEHGTTEPSDFQLSSEFSGVSGEVLISHGGGANVREFWLDEVTITGTVFIPEIPEKSDNLFIDGRHFVAEGNSIPYEIRYNDPDNGWQTITDSVQQISVDDTSIIQLDETNNEIDGVGKGETYIELEHEGLISRHTMTCATIAVEDLELLPLSRKVQAMVTDSSVQGIAITGMAGAVLSRIARNPWVGLFCLTLLYLILWAWGIFSNGLALVAIFFAMLAGMVLLNVDRTDSISVRFGGKE